jgi:hypothetical protein
MEKIDKEELLAREDVEIRVSKLTESPIDNLDLLEENKLELFSISDSYSLTHSNGLQLYNFLSVTNVSRIKAKIIILIYIFGLGFIKLLNMFLT